MEPKKISFGFIKTKKVEKPVIEEKKDYIECLEEKSIKIVGGENVEEKTPLVIPMKPNTLVTAERLQQIAEEVEKGVEEGEPDQMPEDSMRVVIPENETLDQMAARELLQEAKQKKVDETPSFVVPLPSHPITEGEKESTLEDYEAIPIQDFGLAMLRGMGWTPNKDQSKYKEPLLRPKGLGLGADKVIKDNQKKNESNEKDEELSIVKNAFVKIIAGKYNGCYGKIISLDEDNGRVMVDIPIRKETVSLSEFMMKPVTKSEFDKQSKVLNADAYEKYKKNEEAVQVSSRNTESPNERGESTSRKTNDVNKDSRVDKKNENYRTQRVHENSSNGKKKERNHRHRRHSSSSDDRPRHKRRERKRYSTEDSLSSLSDAGKQTKRKESKRHDSSSDSDSDVKRKKDKKHRKSSSDKKRDIDKKRKGKKKKRDRDRSPNYRKHRK